MVPVICIDDNNRPREIKIHKWLKEGQEYHVIFTCTAFLDSAHTKKTLAFHLAEINLGEDELPYEYFIAKRFAILKENIPLLEALIKDCSDTDFSIDQLLEESHLHLHESEEEHAHESDLIAA